MICPYCKQKIKITHTYSGGKRGRVQSGWCPYCRRRFTITSILYDSEQYGGAYKVAKKLEREERKPDNNQNTG